jgi:hypothetical protein
MLPASGAAAAVALAALAVRRSGLAPGDALSLSDPLVVFVPGHGQEHGSEAFADLVRHMGIDDDQARYFDYRWVDGQPDASWASSRVPLDEAAQSLNAYVAGVADEGRPVYLVGFSKGGATVAELVADWDDGHWGPSDAVIGAALLDPPIAAGAQGFVQSLGRRIGPVPDDGGYDPVHCTFLGFGCEDRRVDLGQASGVEVVVIRNPKAAVTSFADVPRGLRVYDVPDPGPTIIGQFVRNPLGVPARIAQAHEAVLHDRSVASCIVAEMRAGRCDLPRRRKPGIRHLRRVGRRSGAQHTVH